ncbi:MAG: hypothetical protein KA792_00810 [Bacteroidales bacterium]|nr:hypothetical protein [Bacteroidales bacterium]
MSRFVKTLGIAGAIMLLLAGIFKMEHIPGANFLLLSGVLFFIFFLYKWYSITLPALTEPKKRTAFIIFFILLIFLYLSNLFKTLHYPGGSYLLYGQLGILIIFFIPSFFIYYKTLTDENKKINNLSIILIFISLSGLMLIKGTSHHSVINSFTIIDKEINSTTNNIEAGNKIVYDSLLKSSAAQKAGRIKLISNSLCNYINELKTYLISESEQIDIKEAETINPVDIKYKDNYDMPTYIMIGNDGKTQNDKFNAYILKDKIIKFKTSLADIIKPDKKETFTNIIGLNVDDVTDIDKTPVKWEFHYFYHTILINDLILLSKIQTDIRLAESVALKNI